MHQPRESPATVVVVVDGAEEVVIGRLPAGRSVDLALVESLARLALDARRGGRSLRLRRPSQQLRELLELAGLTGALGVQPCGKSELCEQLGPEEVVKPSDPPA